MNCLEKTQNDEKMLEMDNFQHWERSSLFGNLVPKLKRVVPHYLLKFISLPLDNVIIFGILVLQIKRLVPDFRTFVFSVFDDYMCNHRHFR